MAASLCSGLTLAQTLQTRPPAGAAQTPAATMPQTSAESVKAAPVTDERCGGDTDQGGAGFGSAGSRRGAGGPWQDRRAGVRIR